MRKVRRCIGNLDCLFNACLFKVLAGGIVIPQTFKMSMAIRYAFAVDILLIGNGTGHEVLQGVRGANSIPLKYAHACS